MLTLIHSADLVIHQTFFTVEFFHRGNKLPHLVQFFISDFWIREHFILKEKPSSKSLILCQFTI